MISKYKQLGQTQVANHHMVITYAETGTLRAGTFLVPEHVTAPKELRKRWVAHGQMYGYPACCILSFINSGLIAEESPRKLDGTGYVPCKECNETYTEEELLARVNKNRSSSLPKLKAHVPTDKREDNVYSILSRLKTLRERIAKATYEDEVSERQRQVLLSDLRTLNATINTLTRYASQ